VIYLPAWPTLPLRWPGKKTGAAPFPWTASDSGYGFIARNLIYRLLTFLEIGPGDVVLAPEYHHGNEIRAIRATGATVRFYPVGFDLQPDLAVLSEMLSARPRALLSIHYFGWPQPLAPILPLCRRHDVTIIEDCALALLSEAEGVPLGSIGDYAVFCLYKTLPVPDGAMWATNDRTRRPLPPEASRSCGVRTLAGRTLELATERIRSRAPRAGAWLAALKRRTGSALRASGVHAVPVGDIGFDRAHVDLGASRLSRAIALRSDFDGIRRRRRRNFAHLAGRLRHRVSFLDLDLLPGVCPLFFPLIVPDKRAAGGFLRERGIETVELWNSGADGDEAVESPACSFLRRHVLELPIHQDITDDQVDYIAKQVLAMQAAMPRPASPAATRLPVREAS